MSVFGKQVKNVLLSCAHDRGLGGIQVMLADLVNGLERNGREVCFIYDAPLPAVRVVATSGPGGRRAFRCAMPSVVRNSMLLSVPVLMACLPLVFLQLAWLIRRMKIDVINCHYLTPYFIHLVIAGRLLRVPVVISVHGADVDDYAQYGWRYRLVSRLIMRGAHRIVACSEALARQTIEVFPQASHKVTYVHNGLDLSRYAGDGAPCSHPRPFLLCVARHVAKKGVDVLLRAFAQVLREVPNLSLVLVGGGPLLEENKDLARALGIEPQVAFMGGVAHDEVSAFYETCALFVLPSRIEPFGLVLLEAAYHRKGIVCTRVGGVPEIVTDSVDAVLVETDDPVGMAAAVVNLLRHPELAAALGAHAHHTLMTRFLWKDRIHDYIAIYEGSPGPSPLASARRRSPDVPLQPA